MKISISNYYKAKLNNKLAILFCHIRYFLKCLWIRADYRYKLYAGRADIHIQAMKKEIDNKRKIGNLIHNENINF